jgi:two-component sensor histidine kinase
MLPEKVEALVVDEDKSKISTPQTSQRPDLPMVLEYRIKKADTGEVAWIARRAQMLLDSDGNPLRMLGTVHDITERKLAEDHLKLLNDELGHRMKNSMTLVQAIASQTLRGTTDIQALKAFNQRIIALSRAHDVMLEQKWSSAKMWEVIEGALAAHADRARFSLSGPRVDLDPKATLSLSMLLHELATNAAKYGALSVPSGHIEITWGKDTSNLTLRWVERAGPVITPPERKGMGTRLIDMGLVGTSYATKSYDPAGFTAEFIAPLEMVEVSKTGSL